MRRSGLVAALPLLLVACAADPALRVPPTRPAPEGLSAPIVAERYARALSSAAALHVTQRTFENGAPSGSSESWMTRDGIRTDVSERGAIVYSLSVQGTQAQERIPAGATADGVRGPRFDAYELTTPGQIEYPRLVSVGWACPVGNVFGTWLGTDPPLPAAMVPRIASSSLVGVADLDGAECAVIRWEPPRDPADTDGFHMGGTYYLDLASGWLVRSDQFQATDRRRIDRTAILRTTEIPSVPAHRFDLNH